LNYEINQKQREVLAYTPEGKLRHRWGPRDAHDNEVSELDEVAWNPVDIVGDDKTVFILDHRHQTVYLHQYGRELLSLFIASQEPNSQWSRMQLDEYGCLLIVDAQEQRARRYNRHGKFLGWSSRNWSASFESQEPISKRQVPTFGIDASYLFEGYWISDPLDSGGYNCQWHRIEISIRSLPPGTEIEIQTHSYSDSAEAPLTVSDPRWSLPYIVVAPTQPPPKKDRPSHRVDEFLVQSGPGQFCSILIRLHGDGFETPVVHSLRLHYPRQSYLQYLPPVYSAAEPMRRFLDSFLSVFQTEWDEFDQRIDESEAYFDPKAVPEGTPMQYLAAWLGLQLEGAWKGEENRRLLHAVPKIYPYRGTLTALRDYLLVYLSNIVGLTPDALSKATFPIIVEGFRERDYLILSESGGTLNRAKPLWSDSVVKRLQIGGLCQVGEVELVSTGDPERDVLHHFAHRVRVYVPAAWVPTAVDERLLRRAIESEMPAHVKYDLCLVSPGICVDIRSTIGFDTIIGDGPPWRLPGKSQDRAPSQPLDKLGQDTVLSRSICPGPAILDSTARVGGWIL
jgi:phage tail-like protein